MKSLLLSVAFIVTVAANAYDSQGGFHPPGGTNPATVTGGFAPPAPTPGPSVATAVPQGSSDRGTSSSAPGDAPNAPDAGGEGSDAKKKSGGARGPRTYAPRNN